ncbi:uncharacterized protein LOC118513891 [Anopheles stephensi]|uniref:uncharacterized protein LOC118513891 n=1 Tax=Anopheles stephensi TaxID=30069 RepID=UPI001658A85E|nr:uncharacterized protein LOC118513891 [Anopheles stephensi]
MVGSLGQPRPHKAHADRSIPVEHLSTSNTNVLSRGVGPRGGSVNRPLIEYLNPTSLIIPPREELANYGQNGSVWRLCVANGEPKHCCRRFINEHQVVLEPTCDRVQTP